MADIFISYKREDRKFCEAVASAAKAEGFTVWWDDALHPAEAWDRLIEREISEASCVIVIWTPRSVDSDWVREEARYGKSQGKLVPVMMDECGIPLGFGSIQYADLCDWSGDRNDERWQRCVKWIKQCLSSKSIAVGFDDNTSERTSFVPTIIDSSDQNFMTDVVERSANLGVLAYFWAPWSGPCKTLQPDLEAAIRHSNEPWDLVRINIDSNPHVASQLSVKSIPVVYAFLDGKPVDGFVGAVPQAEILEMLNKVSR